MQGPEIVPPTTQVGRLGGRALPDLIHFPSPVPMTYAISIGPWHVGPFPTAAHAQHWAERHGCDTWRLIELDDPAEAPAILASMKKARRSHGTGPDASAAVAA